MNKKNILYGFYYCFCIHESAHALITLHKSKERAEMAMEFHKALERKEWEGHIEWMMESDIYTGLNKEQCIKQFPFGQYEDWRIDEVKIEE